MGSLTRNEAATFGTPAVEEYTYNKFDGDPKNFDQWFHEFLMGANASNLSSQFVSVNESAEIPVHSERTKQSLYEEYPASQVNLAFHAWNYPRVALTKEEDRKIMRRAKSPQAALREQKDMYDPVQTMQSEDGLQITPLGENSRQQASNIRPASDAENRQTPGRKRPHC